MTLELREVSSKDLDIFFEHWKDPEANNMAAFTTKNPNSRADFDLHWKNVLVDEEIMIRTILYEREIAGHILSFLLEGERELSYWLGKRFWGKGVATNSVNMFLQIFRPRPLFARTAYDNFASIRVLEKCGFERRGENIYFANSRDKEILEYIFELKK